METFTLYGLKNKHSKPKVIGTITCSSAYVAYDTVLLMILAGRVGRWGDRDIALSQDAWEYLGKAQVEVFDSKGNRREIFLKRQYELRNMDI